ncbi:MAG: hypothetical protein MI923_19790 [Phycisphaerales bacterium]|nr:hypothetical protein [Phycisphaerales bacterium]
MKQLLPYLFILGAIITWGAYVPTIHAGQLGFNPKGPFRAFLFVGVAYCVMGLLIPGIVIFAAKQEPATFASQGIKMSTLAGIFGATGALCVVFALTTGGKPAWVAPLIFAGAPIMNVFVSLKWHPPSQPTQWPFYLGMVMAAVGAGLVLYYKPS